MKRIPSAVMAVVALAVMIGCAGANRAPALQPVRLPPRIDLKQHEMIGVMQFSSPSGSRLGPLATRRFTESIRRDQGLVRIVDVRPETGAARSSAPSRPDQETFKALGLKNGVNTIMTGELKVSSVRPNVQVSALMRSGQVTAQVDATLEVQMIETATGASIWSRSGSATRSVGQVSVFGGKDFSFDADDPDRAYGDLVDFLVEQVARDFHATWERR